MCYLQCGYRFTDATDYFNLQRGKGTKRRKENIVDSLWKPCLNVKWKFKQPELVI